MPQDVSTFGHFLLQEALPSSVSFDGAVTKKDLQKEMSAYAQKDPAGYIRTVQKLKKLGDEVSTWEGLSVGLDDIQPDYKNRDPIIRAALQQVKNARTDAQRRKIITDTEKKILALTPSHPSDMTLMAKSGGRGSMAQLMKTVASPVATQDSDGSVAPWLITKSYAEGLNPADAWLAGANSRRNVIASTGAVVEPGAAAKVITTNMQNLVVTKPDCGTTEGIVLEMSDQVRDRYLAHAAGGFRPNTLLTARCAVLRPSPNR
jgi:DNA-directed RNA polymerase subunit beta'